MLPNQHPSAESIRAFSAKSIGERRAILRHVKSCPLCGHQASELWTATRRPAPQARPNIAASLDAVLRRVAQAELDIRSEREEAVGLWRELEPHPRPRRQTIVRNSRRFSTWGVCELLVSRSRDAVFDDPAEAVHLAELAHELVEHLAPQRYGAALLNDLRARASMTLGNALRVVSDLRGADLSFEEAETALQEGTGDPLERAQLDHYRGSLRSFQRRFSEASVYFDRAMSTYRRCGDTHLEGKTLVAKAATCAKAGRVDDSIRMQRQALTMIDAQREPRLLLIAQHNLAIDLVDNNQPLQALELLESFRPMYARLGDRMMVIRLRWLEAQIFHSIGEHSSAEAAYLEVREAMTTSEIPYDAAVASLELATLYAEQGRTTEIKQLATELVPVFQALEIQRETIAALMLFRQAAEAETATLALVQHIAGFLKRAQHDPALRFSAPE